jgi:hypothetical protein
MARTSFYRLARSSLLPPAAAAAAAAATTALAASTFADEKGGSDDGRRGVGVGGSPTPRSLAAFARRPRGATICEAPHRPSSSSSSSSSSRDANAAVYLPADPAEPDLAPDGRGSKGGMMWGEERDGSVSIKRPDPPLPDFAPRRSLHLSAISLTFFFFPSSSSLVSRKNPDNERRGRHPNDERINTREKNKKSSTAYSPGGNFGGRPSSTPCGITIGTAGSLLLRRYLARTEGGTTVRWRRRRSNGRDSCARRALRGT